MLSKTHARTLAAIATLMSAPLLYPLAAEAKVIGCSIQNGGNTGPGFFAQKVVPTDSLPVFSVECSGEGMTVRGRVRLHSTLQKIQVALEAASGTTSAAAVGQGYDLNRALIPGCVHTDTTVGSFSTLDCGAEIKWVTLAANGSAP